jgi:hypothetical protein
VAGRARPAAEEMRGFGSINSAPAESGKAAACGR